MALLEALREAPWPLREQPTLLGSVAETVVRRAPVPVTVMK